MRRGKDDLKVSHDDFVELSRDGILILDDVGNILRANGPAVSILGQDTVTLLTLATQISFLKIRATLYKMLSKEDWLAIDVVI